MRSDYSRSGSAVVIAISIVLLIAAALIYYFMLIPGSGNSKDPKYVIARRDCELIASSVTKYESAEGKELGFLIDLKKSYLANANSMQDPWKNFYQLDTLKKIIFSKGPDGKTGTEDDIAVSYAGGTGDSKFPLHAASRRGDIEKMKALLKNNADVNAYDDDGRPPVYFAAISHHSQAVKLLISSGALVNAKNKNGESPLFLAAKSGDPGAMIDLLDNGADINASAKYCETPLMRCSASGNFECVKLLIERGAKHITIDDNGESALDKALKNNKTKVADFLKMNGAKKK